MRQEKKSLFFWWREQRTQFQVVFVSLFLQEGPTEPWMPEWADFGVQLGFFLNSSCKSMWEITIKEIAFPGKTTLGEWIFFILMTFKKTKIKLAVQLGCESTKLPMATFVELHSHTHHSLPTKRSRCCRFMCMKKQQLPPPCFAAAAWIAVASCYLLCLLQKVIAWWRVSGSWLVEESYSRWTTLCSSFSRWMTEVPVLKFIHISHSSSVN